MPTLKVCTFELSKRWRYNLIDLLGEKNQGMTLKDIIEYIEAKEPGKRSTSRLLDPQSTDAISSSYRHGKQQDVRNRGGARPGKPKAKPKEVCINCGQLGHSKTPPWHTRGTECSADGEKCQTCGRHSEPHTTQHAHRRPVSHTPNRIG